MQTVQQEDLILYLGDYPIQKNQLLKDQLMKIKGLGSSNVLAILWGIGLAPSKIRQVRVVDITEEQCRLLSDLLMDGFFKSDHHFSNRKLVTLSEEYASNVFYSKDSSIIFFGDSLASQVELAKKRLIKMKCNVGIRLKTNRKVHGQRTKSTGRKTKIIRGFQKKKLLTKKV